MLAVERFRPAPASPRRRDADLARRVGDRRRARRWRSFPASRGRARRSSAGCSLRPRPAGGGRVLVLPGDADDGRRVRPRDAGGARTLLGADRVAEIAVGLRHGVRRGAPRRAAVPPVRDSSGFAPFAWYRIAAGLVMLAAMAAGLAVRPMVQWQWLRRTFHHRLLRHGAARRERRRDRVGVPVGRPADERLGER